MAEANWIYGTYNTFYSRTGGTGAAAAVVLQPGPNETLEIHGISSATATSLFATNATVTNLLATSETVASLFVTAATIGSLNANNVTSKPIFVTIVQANHGFGVGYWLYINGSGVYVLADATSVPTAEVVGVVSSVISVNSFILQTTGYVSGLSGLTSGSCYFLSITPGSIGGLTTSIGNVNKPLLVADGAGSGYFTNYRGELLVAPAQIQTIGALYISSSLTVAASTAASSTATGALIVAGGIGAATAFLQSGTVGGLVATNENIVSSTIAGLAATNAIVTTSTMGALYLNSSLTIGGTAASTSTATGALVVAGGVGAQAAFLQSETVGGLTATNVVATSETVTSTLITRGTATNFAITSNLTLPANTSYTLTSTSSAQTATMNVYPINTGLAYCMISCNNGGAASVNGFTGGPTMGTNVVSIIYVAAYRGATYSGVNLFLANTTANPFYINASVVSTTLNVYSSNSGGTSGAAPSNLSGGGGFYAIGMLYLQ